MEALRKIFGIATLMALLGIMFIPVSTIAADVDVYAEGAYTDTDLVVYIYADINTTNIVSFGVRLFYDSSKLTVASAQKNEAVWYMGDGTNNYPYQDPQDLGNGVLFIGGKLDVNNPTAGVGGTRVLLGTVTFNRTESGVPTSPAEGYFGISLDLGKASPYVNFASVAGDNIDTGVGFSAIVRERGDANGDGRISVQDILRAKTYIGNPNFPPFVDCNNSGDISVQDLLCIKSKI